MVTFRVNKQKSIVEDDAKTKTEQKFIVDDDAKTKTGNQKLGLIDETVNEFDMDYDELQDLEAS